jgi:sterol desaturase/sphingolipid hydroxylase (fatty acid hydroxylase superfamily)
MNFVKIHNKGQAKIFKNERLEVFTKTHPLLIWAMYIPVIALMLYYAVTIIQLSKMIVAIIFIGGVITWTLFEYLIHRFAFHFIPKRKTTMKIVYIIHGNHHEYPRDRQRMFMPPLPSILIAATFFTLMYFAAVVFNISGYVFAFFPGFIFGYLLYGSMHYAIHSGSPPFKWMKALWRNHHLHHYKDEHRGVGVSTTLWDRFFGTMYVSENGNLEKGKIRKMRS